MRPARKYSSVYDNAPTSVCVVVSVTIALPLSGLMASCLKHDGCLVSFQWVALHREQHCKEHVIETLKCLSQLHTSALPPPRRPPAAFLYTGPGDNSCTFTHTAERRCAQMQASNSTQLIILVQVYEKRGLSLFLVHVRVFGTAEANERLLLLLALGSP